MKLQYHAEDQKIIVRIPINLRRWGGEKSVGRSARSRFEKA
jgi:hypothetical protein